MTDNELENISQSIASHSLDFTSIPLHSLNILYMNIRSCRNKLDLIESCIASLNRMIHVIIFTETWLYPNEIFNILGYTSFHCTRHNERGGGVSMFVKDSISVTLLFNSQIDISNFIVIELPEYKLKLAGVYNPGRNVTQFITEIDNLTTNYPNSIIFGDFNINLLNLNDAQVLEYKTLVEGNGYLFLNKITEPFATRESNTVKTVIDHVFTDLCNLGYHFTLLDSDPDLSDHKTIVVSVNQTLRSTNESHIKTILQYDQINESSLSVNNINSFDELVDHYSNIIQSNTKTVEVRTNRRLPKKPYITQEILELIKRKRSLYHIAKQNPLFMREYKSLRNELSNRIKVNKKRYIDEQMVQSSQNPSLFWNHIRELVFNKRKPLKDTSFQIEIDGNFVTDETVLVEEFNKYYENVCNSLIPNWNYSFRNIPANANYPCNFQFRPVTLQTIEQHIDNLNSCAATGLDRISAKFLKKYKNHFLIKYTELANICIENSIFPEKFKQAKVIPIYKAGSKSNIGNYRPISVLNSISKPMERVLCEQIKEYCSTNNIIHTNQFGFVPKSNTLTASVNLINDLVTGLDEKKIVSCIFIDIRKAFDCVHHQLLLHKLKIIGFSVQATNLLESYLNNRIQVVKINNTVSTAVKIKHGVPQGSILGPTLFILYINDIFALPLKGKLQLYADDAAVVYLVDDESVLKSYIEHDLNLLTQYFEQNHMVLNLEKTNFMVFSFNNSNNIRLNISVDGNTIQQVNLFRYLGLEIDQNLKWNSHISSICSKISPYIFALKKIRKFVTEPTAWKIYYAYIHPHLIYMNSIWGCTALTYLSSLKVLQNKSLKIIKGLPALNPSHELYNNKILPLHLLNKFETCCFIYKIVKNLVKTNITLIANSEIHAHDTRSNSNFFIIRSRTRLAQRSLMNRGITLFNGLPNNIKNARSIIEFKVKLKQFLTVNG